MESVESNPNSECDGPRAHILADKSSHSAFWTRLRHSLDAKRANELLRKLTTTESVGPTRIVRNGLQAVNFGSNDYLGLTWHPEVASASHSAVLERARYGSGASPLVTGHSPIHQELQDAIAEFSGTEAAIVFSSGFAANLGTISALASKADVIFSDQLNHASLIDGCRLSGAKTFVYPHADVKALRALVLEHRSKGLVAFIVTDTVFSMDGDRAPLAELVELCNEFDMQCIVDEAHATGVYGRLGRGLTEHLSIESNRVIHVGTLSKAVGCVGGFVAGSRLLVEYLANNARSWIYSTAGTLPNAAAATVALKLLTGMEAERKSLMRTSVQLRTKLTEMGFQVGSGDSPIVAVYMQDPERVLAASQELLKLGVYVPAIRPPTVPEGGSLLRISLSVAHTSEDIAILCSAFERIAS